MDDIFGDGIHQKLQRAAFVHDLRGLRLFVDGLFVAQTELLGLLAGEDVARPDRADRGEPDEDGQHGRGQVHAQRLDAEAREVTHVAQVGNAAHERHDDQRNGHEPQRPDKNRSPRPDPVRDETLPARRRSNEAQTDARGHA